jgi:hypothetical protein
MVVNTLFSKVIRRILGRGCLSDANMMSSFLLQSQAYKPNNNSRKATAYKTCQTIANFFIVYQQQSA